MPEGTGPIIVVLGMHRSGTSWLASELQARGVALGDVNMAATYNERGNRENDRVMRLHDGVLRDNKGSWSHAPRRLTWTANRQQKLAEFIADMDQAYGGTWGNKDPRTLLVYEEWQRQLGTRLRPIGIFRHPDAVADSLLARDMRSADHLRGRRDALRLWSRYCERLVAFHGRAPFPLIRFDVDPADLDVQLTKALDELAVPLAPPREDNFTERLVHQSPASTVPRSCRKAWGYLIENQIC
jgi:hypothetical protein